MKQYCLFFIVLCFVVALVSCEGGAGGRNLTREDSLAICKAFSDTGRPESLKRFVFASNAGSMSSGQDVATMRRYHQSYLKPGNGLPLYSSEEPGSIVRFFNVPLGDIQTIQKAMGDRFGGFRIYLGFDETSSNYHFILVGVDKTTGSNHLVDGEIFNDFKPCPKVCLNAGDLTDLGVVANPK